MSIITAHSPTFTDVEDFIQSYGSDAEAFNAARRLLRRITGDSPTASANRMLCLRVIERTDSDFLM